MLLQIDATFIFVFVSFVVFVFLMNLICYKPLTMLIKKREGLLYKNKETVDETNNKKAQIVENMKKELSNAEFEGSNILKETSNRNKKEKEEAILNKKEEIFNNIQDFENKMNASSIEAKNILKTEVEEYVKMTVSKILDIGKNSVYVDKNRIEEIVK